MIDGSSFETPVLLLAMPQVHDPFFRKSVILLVRHEDDEGSLGFIVNRPMELTISEILEEHEIEWTGSESPHAFFGGPVSPEMGTLLYGAELEEDDEDEDEDEDEETGGVALGLPGVAASHSLEDLRSMASGGAGGTFRLFLGYAGWEVGQLEQEILRNDWLIAPVDPSFVFSDAPGEVWRRAVESVGIDPDHLPAFTQTSLDESGEPAAN